MYAHVPVLFRGGLTDEEILALPSYQTSPS